MPDKVDLIILGNEVPGDADLWIKTGKAENATYKVIDLTGDTWLKEIQGQKFSYMVAKPSCRTNKFKQLYDKRISELVGMGHPVYPSAQEIYIYENKSYFASW